jgi:hypothetical protein
MLMGLFAASKYPGHDELPNNAELSSMRLVKFSHLPVDVQYLLCEQLVASLAALVKRKRTSTVKTIFPRYYLE